MNAVADPVARYDRLIAASRGTPGGSEPAWLDQRRRAAGEQFRAHGFPTRKHEAWRYTSLEPLLDQDFVAAAPVTALQQTDLEELLVPGLESWRIVLVNGRFAPHLSDLAGLPGGVQVNGLAAALAEGADWLQQYLGAQPASTGEVFARLNLAALQDGVALRVPAGVRLAQPLEILHVTVGVDDASVAQPRHVLLFEAGCSATLIERYVALGDSLYFNNVACDLALEAGAELRHYRLQEESRHAFQVHNLVLRQAGDSRYSGLGIALGGSWSRADWRVDFTAPGAECDLKGLYLVGDGQLVDNHLDVRHVVPGCSSREDFRGVLNGRGRGVFDGRILVGRDAQKSDARLANANLMLSRQAEIDTKPQLEIFADDVACSHGTTVGEIEPEMLFYLRTRGIPEAQARRMISQGFARAVYQDCAVPQLGEYIERRVGARLAQEAGN
jgi:Fe-S cluster assembly protein SufD